jgi:hypothetical protein
MNCLGQVTCVTTKQNSGAAIVNEIMKRMEDAGGGGFAQCTWNVRSVLSGIGPFKSLGSGRPFSWPANLASELKNMPDVRIGKEDRFK